MNNGWYKLLPHINKPAFQTGEHQRTVTALRPVSVADNARGRMEDARGRVGGRIAVVDEADFASSGSPWVEVIDDYRLIMNCFMGKGMPQHIVQTLRLCHLFGIVGGTKAALQRFCDDKIGLDCGGFVGAYLKSQGSPTFHPDMKAGEFAEHG